MNSLLRVIAIVFSLISSLELSAQLDTIHWLPPIHGRLPSYTFENYLYISTPSNTPVQYTVKIPGGLLLDSGVVSNNSPVRYNLGTNLNNPILVSDNSLNYPIQNKGVVIESSYPCYVNYRCHGSYSSQSRQATITSLKGNTALGKEFRVGGIKNLIAVNGTYRSSFFSFMATKDSTFVYIDDIPLGVTFQGNNAPLNTSDTVFLDKGESAVFSLYTTSIPNIDGILGIKITSNHDISLMNGFFLGNIGTGNYQDIGVDQPIPINELGTRYILVKGDGANQYEQVIVIAHSNNTQLFLNGSLTPSTTLNQGDYYIIDGTNFSVNNNLLIESNNTFYCYQHLLGGASSANGDLNFIPPISCGMPKIINNIPAIDSIGNTSFSGKINIIGRAQDTIQVFSQSGLTTLLPGSGNVVTGNNDWRTHSISGLSGKLKIVSTGSVACNGLGYNLAAGYAAFFSGFGNNLSANFSSTDTFNIGSLGEFNFTGNAPTSTNFSWDWDGGVPLHSTVEHEYLVKWNSPGWKRITLTLTNGDCLESYVDSVFIQNDPVICAEDSIKIFAHPTNTIKLWSTGDTTSTISASPSSTSKYWVRQIAGTDTIVDTITVNVLDPTINISTNLICNPGDSVMLWTTKDSTLTQSCGGMPTSLQNGLMAYYPFCGNANDLSGFGNHGTVINATLTNDRNGNPQSAYYFDGSSKITVPSASQISDSLNTQVTFSVWINVESYPNNFGPILSKNGPSSRQFEVWIDPNTLGFWGTQFNGSTSYNVPFSTWLNYVVTFDQGTVKYYINSSLIHTATYLTTSLAGNNSIFEIGHDSPGSLELFKGHIDDIGIWNRVLSQADIANLYNNNTNYSNTLWSTGETTDSIWINPTTDTTIWVSSTLGNVTCVDSIDIEVNNCLTITESDTTICLGETLSLSANLNLQAGCLMNISYTGIPPGDPIPGFTYGGLYNGHYYYVYDTPTSWTQGEQLCRQNGGYLVCIDDINENTFVSNLVPSFSNKNIWIGLYRDSTTCQFRWLNCINIAYTNWRPGEPNSGPCGEPYAQIIRGCSFGLNTWNNLGNNASNGSCYSNMVPILEIDPTIGSTASTSILWSTGDTTNTINVSPTSTTKYWVRKTIDSDTIIDTITVHVLDPTINATSTTVCSASDSVMLWINADSTSTPSVCGDLPSGLNSGLVAWYPFCGNANDESTYSNNGTIYGASLTSDRYGNMNSAYDFDGDDWIQVPHNSQIDFSLSDDYTVSCWVSATSPNSSGSVYEKWDNSFLPYPFVLRTVSNSDVIVNRYTGGFPQNQSNNHSTSFSSNLLTIGSYDHIVNVFTPDTMYLYLNGALIDSEVNPMTAGGSINNTHPLYIGRRGVRTDRFFTGKIDDLGIWNRALTQSEITQLYSGANISSTLWSTGETTDTIWINPTTDTTIWVSSYLGNVTCIDSIDIEFLNPQIQSNRMGVCAPGDTAMLWVENESNAITWSTGETSDTIYVTPTVDTSYWVQFTSFSGICSDTIEIDVSEPIEIFGDSLACAGDSILLYTIPSQTVSNQEIPDSLMYQVTKTFGQNWQVDWAISPNDWYLLEVSGLWNFTSCSNHRDPAYWTSVSCLSSNLQMTPYTLNCAGGNASWWIADSCNQRPINDIYSTNHTYTYKVRASDGNLTLKFYDDQHSDNGGALSFKLYSIKDSSVTTENPVNWSTGETTDSIWVKPTQTTTYWVSGTDQYGCLSTDSITVFVSDIQNSISTQEPSCNGSSDGQAQVNPTGGVSPYTFLWSNGSGSSMANNLSSDTMWVAVTDSIGCSAVDTFFLDQPDSLLITSILTSSYNGYNVSCNGGSDGNVNTTVAGGTMPYYYNWNNNTYTTSGISNVSAGTYILQVTDTNGCMVSQTVLLSEPNPIIISPSITSNYNGYAISCYGESDGSADVNISGGISPYTILWSNGTPTSSMTNVPSGSYSVMITDGNGCIDSTQIYLSQPNPLSATAIVTDASCYGERNGRIELSLSGGAGSFNINWNTGDTGITIDNIPSDWYSYNVISSNNCSYEDSIFLDHPMPLSIELDTIHPTCINSFDGELNIIAMGGTPGYNYFLNGNAFTGSIQGLGTDSLRILAVDFNNCDTVFVIAMPPVRDPCIFIPNWFSPNGNSEEDTWLIDGFEYGELTLKIFNVFGQELYRTESTNYTPWDGTFNGKLLPAGDYYYVITSALLNNNYTGYVTLLR